MSTNELSKAILYYIKFDGGKMDIKMRLFKFACQLQKFLLEYMHFFNQTIYITLFGKQIKQVLEILIAFLISLHCVFKN